MGIDAIVTGISSSLHRNWTVVVIIIIVLGAGGGGFAKQVVDSGAAGFLIFASIIVSIQTLVCVMCAGIAGFFVVLAVFAPVLLLFVVLSSS